MALGRLVNSGRSVDYCNRREQSATTALVRWNEMLLAHYGHLRIILPCAIRKLCISGHLFASNPIVRCSYTFVVVPRELLLTVTRMHLLCCSYPIPGRVPSINILPPELRVCHRNSVQQQFQWTQQRQRCRSWAQHDRHELHWSNICAAEQHAATRVCPGLTESI